MKKLRVIALAALLSLGGCTPVHSIFDGATGAPVEATDSPGWYHVGQILIPVLSNLVAIFRRAVIGG